MLHVARSTLPVLLVVTRSLGAQQSLPPLPDTTGFGVHVLALARGPDNALWVGTYGQGIFVLRPGAGSWEQIKHSSDTTGRTISFDFVHAFEGNRPSGRVARVLDLLPAPCSRPQDEDSLPVRADPEGVVGPPGQREHVHAEARGVGQRWQRLLCPEGPRDHEQDGQRGTCNV